MRMLTGGGTGVLVRAVGAVAVAITHPAVGDAGAAAASKMVGEAGGRDGSGDGEDWGA